MATLSFCSRWKRSGLGCGRCLLCQEGEKGLWTTEPDSCFCPQFPPSARNFQEAQSHLNQAAAGLNQSANELVQASRGTPQDLAKASGKFGQDFNEFLQAGVEMAGQSQVRAVLGEDGLCVQESTQFSLFQQEERLRSMCVRTHVCAHTYGARKASRLLGWAKSRAGCPYCMSRKGYWGLPGRAPQTPSQRSWACSIRPRDQQAG